MKCNFCGFEFDEKESISGCKNCPLKKNCSLVKCPNCGYETLPEPDWIKKIKQWRYNKNDK